MSFILAHAGHAEESVWDVLLDALIDSAKLLPFLLLIYILMEFIEHNSRVSRGIRRALSGKAAPLAGAGFGLLPQCGFSVMATNLYAKKYITVGTLLAVFIATSDEAIPIMLSNPDMFASAESAWKLPALLGTKFLFALVVGFGANLIFGSKKKSSTGAAETVLTDTQTDKKDDGCLCGHEHRKEDTKRHKLKTYLLMPALHSFKIFAYILTVNIILGISIFYIGEDRLADFLLSSNYFQPVIAALVGLIPNCASSVLITTLFMEGMLSFGSVIAGLSVNAGIALFVLFQQNKNLKNNLLIVFSLFVLSVAFGSLVMFIENVI